MEIFKVPTREVAVGILLDNGQLLEGLVYVAARGPDGKPGRVADRLNDPAESFLPVNVAGDSFLVSKSGIVSVRLDRGPETVDLEESGGRAEPVRLTLVGGDSVVGELHISMPPEKMRVLDYLNAAPRFLPLLTGEQVTLVQRSYIIFVRSLEGS